MSASVGDRGVVHGHTVGSPQRHGAMIEIGGVDGGPPFVVRWGDGHEGPFFPSCAPRRVPRHPAAGPDLTVAVGGRPAIRPPSAGRPPTMRPRTGTIGQRTGEARGRRGAAPSPPVHTTTYRPNEGRLEGIASMRRRDLRRRLRNVPPRFHSEAPKRSTSELLPSNVIYAIHRGMQPSDRPVTLR
ncbi:DUF1918 domain-containing protein [Frankia tisae]|uniref:DUF1918 domain-containing protein n=1 Tax=Frankia tisae TaxID=2950104 RepID=UPI0021C10FF7|nr:DUF1918 domain-containing protein [Frankia tisae]